MTSVVSSAFRMMRSKKMKAIMEYQFLVGTTNGYKHFSSSSEKHVFAATPSQVHMTSIVKYPDTVTLPLPNNIEDIADSEKGRFSPQRARDISGPVIVAKSPESFNSSTKNISENDPHLDSYDCIDVISLNASMQSNVPQPFSSDGDYMHLNMPGGQWSQSDKYVSEDLQNAHFSNVTNKNHSDFGKNKTPGTYFCVHINGCLLNDKQLFYSYIQSTQNNIFYKPLTKAFKQSHRFFSSMPMEEKNLSRKEKLKQAVKEYGATVIVFHVAISLVSLGGFYLAVSSGLDVASILQSFGANNVAAGASTFVMAYAVHKVCAPIRISITLTATPFIVRYLRRIGFIKGKHSEKK